MILIISSCTGESQHKQSHLNVKFETKTSRVVSRPAVEVPQKRQACDAKKRVEYVGQVTRPLGDSSILRVLAPQDKALKLRPVYPVNLTIIVPMGKVSEAQVMRFSFVSEYHFYGCTDTLPQQDRPRHQQQKGTPTLHSRPKRSGATQADYAMGGLST